MAYWLVWLFVIRVRDHSFDSLTARRLVITTFAQCRRVTAVFSHIHPLTRLVSDTNFVHLGNFIPVAEKRVILSNPSCHT